MNRSQAQENVRHAEEREKETRQEGIAAVIKAQLAWTAAKKRSAARNETAKKEVVRLKGIVKQEMKCFKKNKGAGHTKAQETLQARIAKQKQKDEAPTPEKKARTPPRLLEPAHKSKCLGCHDPFTANKLWMNCRHVFLYCVDCSPMAVVNVRKCDLCRREGPVERVFGSVEG